MSPSPRRYAYVMEVTLEQLTRSVLAAAAPEALRHEGEKWASWLQGLPEDFLSEQVRMSPHLTPSTKSRFELLLSVKEHEMHHRAQLMLIQRLLGMVPHLTREREKMRQTVAPAQTS